MLHPLSLEKVSIVMLFEEENMRTHASLPPPPPHRGSSAPPKIGCLGWVLIFARPRSHGWAQANEWPNDIFCLRMFPKSRSTAPHVGYKQCYDPSTSFRNRFLKYILCCFSGPFENRGQSLAPHLAMWARQARPEGCVKNRVILPPFAIPTPFLKGSFLPPAFF